MRKTLIMLLLFICISGCSVKDGNYIESPDVATTSTSYEYAIDVPMEQVMEPGEDEVVLDLTTQVIYGGYEGGGISVNEIHDYHGKTYTKALGNGIEIQAQVSFPDIEELNVYSYVTMPCDDVRSKILGAVFEDGIDLFFEDQKNPGYYEYKYGEKAGDYYLYHTIYPCAGPTVYGEMAFYLSNAAPNLYPFEDNIMPESDSFKVIIKEFDPFDMAEQVIRSIDCYDGWELQYFLPYGTQGKNPFFRLVYKLKQDNIYVNAYNDTYFLIDQNGIQTFTGAFFDLTKERRIEQVIPLEDAIEILDRELPGTEVTEYSDTAIDRISIEYIVVQEEDGSVSCSPFWRFYLSYNEYAGRNNQNLLCGVNMVTGEFVFEERGFWF